LRAGRGGAMRPFLMLWTLKKHSCTRPNCEAKRLTLHLVAPDSAGQRRYDMGAVHTSTHLCRELRGVERVVNFDCT
jgi:hypothetical protein